MNFSTESPDFLPINSSISDVQDAEMLYFILSCPPELTFKDYLLSIEKDYKIDMSNILDLKFRAKAALVEALKVQRIDFEKGFAMKKSVEEIECKPKIIRVT